MGHALPSSLMWLTVELGQLIFLVSWLILRKIAARWPRRKKMMRKWLKGARLIRRKLLSATIVDELKRCLKRHGPCMQWTVAQLRDHVSTVVACPIHGGQALIFFHKKLQQLLTKKRRRKPAPIVNEYCAVPKGNFTADPVQFQELRAMRRHDFREC